ncbi:uncharacterized protein LOC124300923 [Neodiprion virginianus]|uniref:uncharacterized protein LOC124300923 n=1 Tax=Neodiprion virginianus TaxID=2961670 RepID=UPI001EE715B1|nr:uncharacterized protein LOC124300923 [Neodiprion virginianus]
MHHLQHLPGLEATYPHTSTAICFASRITGFYPQWMNIFVAKQIWIGVGLITLFLTVVLYLYNKSQGIVSTFLDAVRFVIGNSVIRLPESINHRLTFGIIFLAFIVLDAVFRGRFVSILAYARRYPNLDTIEQVKEHGMEFYGFGPLRYVIDDPLLGEHYHELLPEECLASIERDGKQRACLAHCLTLPSMMVNSTIIHRASEPIISDYATFIVTLNWPMTDRWNFDVQKLVEAGIVEKWCLDFDRVMEIKSWKTQRMIEPPHVEPIAINTLLSAFVILILGLLIALVTFAWEIKIKCNSYYQY